MLEPLVRSLARVYPMIAMAALLPSIGCGDKKAERIDMTRYVWVDPGPAVVGMAGKSAKMNVVVRNVYERELGSIRLLAASECCNTHVTPREIARLIPGDRTSFAVTLTRRAKSTPRRYPLALTVTARGLPLPAGVDLVADLRGPADQDWIDVGQVKLVHHPRGRSSYYLLAAIPLLILVGWLLWRLARRRARREST